MSAQAKICGIRTAEDARVCALNGATYVGLVFFERSPRNVTIAEARELSKQIPEQLKKVALVVNPEDQLISEIVATAQVDILQLHGGETPERVSEIRSRFGLPVMKAVGIAEKSDLLKVDLYSDVADILLIDANPPKGGPLPGGNGVAFDWELIADANWEFPWMLAGGLTPENVAEAIRLTGAPAVDVSSGVEGSPGIKDPAKIEEFLQAIKAA